MKQINIDSFLFELKNKRSNDLVYFNLDLLQNSYKEETQRNLKISEKFSVNKGLDIGVNSFGISLGAKNSKEKHEEEILTPKEIIEKVFSDYNYNTYLFIYKIRMSEVIYKKKGTHNEVTFESKPTLQLLKYKTPIKVTTRARNNKDYFLKKYIHLNEAYTLGIYKNFLFPNDNEFYKIVKPDIDADFFYLVYLKNSVHNVREVCENGEFYDLIDPILIIKA